VDVTGIEPVTPCLQSNPRNIMWLILLAFTYVMQHGFSGCLELIVPVLFLHFVCRPTTHNPNLAVVYDAEQIRFDGGT
jgi:hypothetical protein